MKAEKKEIILARKSGERKDDETKSDKELYTIGQSDIKKESIDENNNEIFDEEINKE